MDPMPTKNLPLKERLDWIMSVPCTYEIDNRVVIDDDTYTKLFGTVMNVKTLRTEKPTITMIIIDFVRVLNHYSRKQITRNLTQ